MKFVITENQFNFITESLSWEDKYSLIKNFEKVVNHVFKKRYDWFKNMEIFSIVNDNRYQTSIHGVIFVNGDWGYKQFREYYWSSNMPDELFFGDIIGSELGNQFRYYFKSFLNALDYEVSNRVNLTDIKVEFVDDED